MAGSIAFERPQENAIEELKEHLSHIDVAITKEQEINNGAGVKLHGLYQNKQVAYVLYFNRSKGQSSKIVAEKSTPEINEQLTRLLTGEIVQGSALKKIPVHSSITIADNRLFPVIKQSLVDAGYLNKEYQKQDHVEYMLKLSFKSDELTLTLFKTGTLLLQGMYSNLFDLVVSVIDSIKPLSDEERTLLLVPKEDRENILADLQKKPEITKSFAEKSRAEAGGYFGFLFENDQKCYRTGDILTKIIQESKRELPEYNFLVAIFAKVFEGFLIKLLIDKDFFTSEQYRNRPSIADIGNALRKKKLKKYIKDPNRNGYILEQLIAIWEGARCKEMHSDPLANQKILSIPSLDAAIEKIGGIKSCMKEAYEILVLDGYSDTDLSVSAAPKVVPTVVSAPKSIPDSTFSRYIGTDESGKGDYIGPLVIAGVYLDEESSTRLQSMGVRDSKKISDNRIVEFARIIKENIEKAHYSVVVIGPEKYNQLYNKIGNLNTLLAWGHARAIENILSKTDCKTAVADQFGNETYIQKALMEKGKKIDLIQMPKAEKHPAVAAASILAREAFLYRMKKMGTDFGIQMPKGASQAVIDTCKTLVQKRGSDVLQQIAKVHFKTTQKILG